MTPEEKAIVASAITKIDAASISLKTLLVVTPDPEPEPPEPEPPPELPEHPELASRTSGVAPLHVYFDAGDDAQGFRVSRHDWDFDDPQSGTWATSGRSKNAERGPIAGHVFERPGTYVVTLDAAKQVTIVVEDPDVVFAGDKTVCFSQSGEFPGAPAGAQLVTTSSLAAVTAHVSPGRRLLLRRGETWQGGAVTFGGTLDAPGIIGAFGEGERPVINTAATLFTPRWLDWRIMDLEVVGPGTGDTRALRASGWCKQVLVYRCVARSVKSGWHFSTSQLGGSGPLYDQCAIVECGAFNLVGGQGGNGSMFAGRQALFLGNHYDNMQGVEHVMRCPWLQGCVIAHNDLGRPAQTKHVLKLHGPPYPGTGLGHHQHTERVFIARNLFRGGLASWIVAAGPEDDHTDQRVRDVLIEGNRVEAGSEMQAAFWLSSVGTLARNNEVIGTGGKACTAFQIARRGIEPVPSDVQVLHNTAYTADPDRFTLCSVISSASSVRVQGNLGSAPNSTQKAILSGPATDLANLLSDQPGFVDAPGGNFALLPSSPAADQAPPTPDVWDDAAGTPRGALYDCGAYEVAS